MKSKNINKEFIVAVVFSIIVSITLINSFLVKDFNKVFRVILTLVTIIGVYLTFKKGFLKGASIIYYINMFFIFLSMYLASVWNAYAIPNYDKFLHLLSGAIIAIIGYALFIYLTSNVSREKLHPLASFIFVVIFSTALAGAWEIWEFTTDSLFGLSAQNNSLNDTMWDIICGTAVGIITAIPIYINSKGKNIKIINKLIEEIEENKKK